MARLGNGFGRLWTASAAGNLGDGIGGVAIALLAVRLTRDPFAVSVIRALSFLPWLVLGLPSGALVDRHDRRRLAVAVGLARAGCVGLLCVAAAADRSSLWLLYGVVLALGVCETVYDNAVTSMVPMVVADRDRLEAANGRLQGVELMGQSFLGPLLGSAVFTLAAAAAFGVNAATFLLAALLLATLPGGYRAAAGTAPDTVSAGTVPAGAAPEATRTRTSMRAEMGAALRYIRGHHLHRATLGVLVVTGFANALATGTLPLWAREVLGVGEAAYGPFILALALGALVGSQTGAALARWVGRGRALTLSVLVTGLGTLAAAATASPYLAGAALAATGWAVLVWNVVGGALRQRVTPASMLGRTIGIYRVVTWGVMPLGALAGGAVARAAGLRAPLVVSGGLMLLTAVLAARTLTNGRVAAAIADADAAHADAAAEPGALVPRPS